MQLRGWGNSVGVSDFNFARLVLIGAVSYSALSIGVAGAVAQSSSAPAAVQLAPITVERPAQERSRAANPARARSAAASRSRGRRRRGVMSMAISRPKAVRRRRPIRR
jgi:hypothetical protein